MIHSPPCLSSHLRAGLGPIALLRLGLKQPSTKGLSLKNLTLCAVVLALASPLAFAAERSPACEAKQASIKAQIAEATTRGRSREVASLKRALAANKAGGTDAVLAQARDADIQKAQSKVAAREKELGEAERKGDARKIATRKTKLDEARKALAEAEKPLTP